MLKEKSSHILIIVLPFFILLCISGYFVIKSWSKYQDEKRFDVALNNVQLLQDYEIATLREALCRVLVPDSNNQNNLCEDRIESTKNILKDMEKNIQINVIQKEILRLKNKLQSMNISNFENIFAEKGVMSSTHSYLETLILKTNLMSERKLLQLYIDLSEVRYATELENFLVTYYLSKEIPISTANIIFWDKLVNASFLMDFENIDNISAIKEILMKIIRDKDFNHVLNQIDDMRITILTGQITYENKNFSWIKLLDQKEKVVKRLKVIVYKQLKSKINAHATNNLNIFLMYLFIFFFTFFALFLVYRKIKQDKRDNEALLTVVNKISALSSYLDTESEVMHKMLDHTKNKEDIYTYINSSFQLLHEKRKQANDKVNLKSQFISTLSHEIRTPLNGIIGFSKLLREVGTTANQEEFLSLIEGSSNKLIMIVNDILELSKINADKMKIENISFDIFEIIESTVAMFTQETDQKDIELGLFIDPFISHYFLGDATKLSQVLINLIGNAIKFTDTYGKINIFVQSINTTSDKSQIKFAVQDNGIGLTEEQMEYVFNPFTQGDKYTSEKYGGTGLGLTLSSKMVELMGGKLEVTSIKNKSTTFNFTLTLIRDKTKVFSPYPKFIDLSVGLALPLKNIKRQLDSNLETYMRHLGVNFSYYYYDDIFNQENKVRLPNIMIFDHHYARLSGELEQCVAIKCKSVLLTRGTLRSRINPEKHHFDDILLTPVSIRKCLRILDVAKYEKKLKITSANTFKNIDSFIGLEALVVDDNLINRKLIKIILEKIGLGVTLAIDGKDAFDKYQKNKYSIVFMDIQMPVMDGIESTHNILRFEKRNKLPHVPIIALTANVSTGDKKRYMSEGMDDYATKPLDIEILKHMISKHCLVRVSSEDKEK